MAKGITFTKKVKEEITLDTFSLEEKRAILSGFIRYSGTLSISPKMMISFSSSSASVSKFMFQALKEVYGIKPKLNFTKQLRLDKNTIYHVEVNEKTLEILEDLEIYKDFEPMISTKKFLNNELFRFFIIGTFLASGQVSDPNSGRYFCEMVFNEGEEADVVLKKLHSYKDENTMSFKKINRRNKWVLYLKQSDQISVFLNFLGAVGMMFEFENARLERDFINNENRLTICAQANYSRSLKNGEENIKDIQLLKEKIGDVYFTEKTRLLAEVRMEHKDASYQELSEFAANKGLVMSKSGVVHVFKKIHEDALRIQKEMSNTEDK